MLKEKLKNYEESVTWLFWDMTHIPGESFKTESINILISFDDRWEFLEGGGEDILDSKGPDTMGREGVRVKLDDHIFRDTIDIINDIIY